MAQQKPFSGIIGNYGMVPIAYDASDTPVESPIAGGATASLTVPTAAVRLHLLVAGEAAATVTILTGETAADGALTIPPGVHVQLDVAGLGDYNYPDIVKVVAGADSPVSFWFDSMRPGGV